MVIEAVLEDVDDARMPEPDQRVELTPKTQNRVMPALRVRGVEHALERDLLSRRAVEYEEHLPHRPAAK